MARLLVNGDEEPAVHPLDRGLMYGDGLFETIRFVGSHAPLWDRHMQRLAQDARRLMLPEVDPAVWLVEASRVTEGMPESVVRLTLTRGIGQRGYALPGRVHALRVVAAFTPPPLAAADHRDGIVARVCDLRLGVQPALAGIKHLNRLEQVLARAEWHDPAIAEGLLLDEHGRVISATMANVFAVIDGELVTPCVDRCGVAGVARAQILATRPARECQFMLDDLWRAKEVFLSSSVRGILPLRAVGNRAFKPGLVARALQEYWRDMGFFRELA